MSVLPPFEYRQKQSPPMPVDSGSMTHWAAQAAMAASMALPPAFSTSMATWVASGCEVQAMPSVACTGDLPGSSRFLMRDFLPRKRPSAVLWNSGWQCLQLFRA
jgi:hypothetical protein